MKKLGVLLLTLSLLFGLIPQSAMAAQSTTFEQELTQYLGAVSNERGFEVTKADLEKSIASYELSFDLFESVEDIELFFGEVIKSDLSNLDNLYEEYNLEQDSLSGLLMEFGEEINDYIFLNDLNMALYLYTDDGVFERDASFDQDFADYLVKISEARGFEVTKEAVEAALALFELKLDEFESVSALSDLLGDVINADLSNLDYFVQNYELDQATILQLIADNGKDINDFVFLSELELLVWSSYEGAFPDFDLASLAEAFRQIGLTDEELQKLEAHFASSAEYFSSEEVMAKLTDLGTRMMTFAEAMISAGGADESYLPSEAEIAELVSLYDEMLTLFKLKLEFGIIKDGIEASLSFTDVFKLTEAPNGDFVVKLYNLESQLLADVVVTSDLINSDLEDILGEDQATKETATDNEAVKTVKGAKLPKTASNYIPNALVGLLLAIAGILVYRKVRNVKGENI